MGARGLWRNCPRSGCVDHARNRPTNTVVGAKTENSARRTATHRTSHIVLTHNTYPRLSSEALADYAIVEHQASDAIISCDIGTCMRFSPVPSPARDQLDRMIRVDSNHCLSFG